MSAGPRPLVAHRADLDKMGGVGGLVASLLSLHESRRRLVREAFAIGLVAGALLIAWSVCSGSSVPARMAGLAGLSLIVLSAVFRDRALDRNLRVFAFEMSLDPVASAISSGFGLGPKEFAVRASLDGSAAAVWRHESAGAGENGKRSERLEAKVSKALKNMGNKS